MVEVIWKGGMAFEATPPSGSKFTMDAYSDDGSPTLGPTPVEAFLSAIAACTAMDVVSILKKQRQEITAYRLEVEGDREPHGSPYPRPFLALRVRHYLTGVNLDPVLVKKAVDLSDEKYCTVAATLRSGPPINTEWFIEDQLAHS